MAGNLTRIDPFNDIARFGSLRGIEDFFRNIQPRSWLDASVNNDVIKMDVHENDKGYVVKADIPGVKKEDIKIDINGNRVSISAESRKESEKKEGDYVCNERYYGQQSRVFTLGHELDNAGAQASYKDGVLELSIPKRAENSGKRIAIS